MRVRVRVWVRVREVRVREVRVREVRIRAFRVREVRVIEVRARTWPLFGRAGLSRPPAALLRWSR